MPLLARIARPPDLPPFLVLIADDHMAVQPRATAWALAAFNCSTSSLCSCIMTTFAGEDFRYSSPEPQEETFTVTKWSTKSSFLGL